MPQVSEEKLGAVSDNGRQTQDLSDESYQEEPGEFDDSPVARQGFAVS